VEGIEELSLDLGNYLPLISNFFEAISFKWPDLRSLQLTIDSSYVWKQFITRSWDVTFFLDNFPKLTHLSIRNLSYIYHLSSPHASLRSILKNSRTYQLERFEANIVHISASALLYVLVCCPHLQELNITFIYPDLDMTKVIRMLRKKGIQLGDRLKKSKPTALLPRPGFASH